MRRIMFVLCLPGASQLWGAIGIDVTVLRTSRVRARISPPRSFSTTSPNKLLLLRLGCRQVRPHNGDQCRGPSLTWVGLAHKRANGRRRNLAGLCPGYAFNLT